MLAARGMMGGCSAVKPGLADGRAIRMIRCAPGCGGGCDQVAGSVPAVEQIWCEGLELPPGLTVLGGERFRKVHRGGNAGRSLRAQSAGMLSHGGIVPGQGQ